ncbi:MAG: hypothetical protein ABW133_01710 [Polyangiaceae bacterium]
MGRFLFCATLLLLSACSRAAPPPAPRAPSSSEEPPRLAIPRDLRASVERSVALGREIYLQDKAGAIGTDAVLAKEKTLEGKGMGGFMALREGDEAGRPLPGYVVLFYTRGPEFSVRYEVRVPLKVGARPSVESINPPRVVSGDLATFIRARQTALEAAGPFDHAMNPVILPDPDGGILVYLLTPATRRNTVVFGKHFRVSLTVEGKVKSVEPLSRGELEISTAAPAEAEKRALFVSHLVSSYPLETHVAASLTADLPIYVVTSRGLWFVDHDDIAYVSEQVPDEMGRVVSGIAN